MACKNKSISGPVGFAFGTVIASFAAAVVPPRSYCFIAEQLFFLIRSDYNFTNTAMTQVLSAGRPNLRGQTVEPILPVIFPNKTAYPSKVMHCDVVFGSPSMDCNGTGICRITGTNSFRTLPKKKACQLTFGQIAAAPDSKISLFFFREFLCIQLYRQHFRKGVLAMKEACPIPSEIAKGLNLFGKNLLPGNYAITECDGYFRVDLDCA